MNEKWEILAVDANFPVIQMFIPKNWDHPSNDIVEEVESE